MSEEPAPADDSLSRIAERQHGAVTTRQLAAVGIDKDAIRYRAQIGRLHRVHRGVYAVGHPALSREGRWMAAVLACGERAVLSHRSAAALWRLLPTANGPVDVSVPGAGGRDKRTGIRQHRTRSLMAAEVTRRRGIPVTTPARTIADLRRVVSPEDLRQAIREAAVLGLDIGRNVEAEPTRSELEHRFLRLCRHYRLTTPRANASVGRFVVDFLWPDESLIVETDGYRYHRGRQAFEDDRVRDVELRLLGYEVVRFSYRQVLDDPARLAAALRTMLVRRAARPR